MDTNLDLKSDFEESEHSLRLRQSKIAFVLGITLIPAGLTLDLISYPEYINALVIIRFYAAGLLTVLFLLLFTEPGAKYVRYVALAGFFIAAASISLMVAIVDGPSSSYYLGLFLMIFCVGVVMPLTLTEAGITCSIIVLTYVPGALAGLHDPAQLKQLWNNLYFLILTSIISSTAAHYNTRRRWNEFKLKYRLQEQHHKLEELDRLKSQFFANVSHELRTPLTLILAPLEKLKSSSSLPQTTIHELAEVMENNALRLLRLVNDILNLVRMEEGNSDLRLNPYSLSAYLRQAVKAMKHLADLKNVQLTLNDCDSDLAIQADGDAVEKIFTNLISNALKFTPENGSISISALQNDDEVIVTVKDTGIGIPPESLPLIFDRFFQVDGSNTRRFQGVGLGLSLVRELVERHNGTIKAKSVPGEGTEFILTFPRISSEAFEAESEEGTIASNAHEPFTIFNRRATSQVLSKSDRIPEIAANVGPIKIEGPRAKVLVVDDEPDILSYLTDMLAEHYDVIQSSDGNDAIAQATKQKPHLMLLDLMLPGVNGLSVCKTLKADPETRSTKIVMLTARVDDEAKIKALQNGADDFLVKPFSGLEIRTRIANLLKSGRLETDLKTSNTELEKSLKSLRETEALLVQNARLSALGTMAAGLMHEIGNPLNFIGSALSIAMRDQNISNHPDTLDTIKDIKDGFDRISRIVLDLREFTSPQQPQSMKQFDLKKALENSLRFTSRELTEVKLDVDAIDGCIVQGSQSLVSQVIVNLLVNAAAATKSNSADHTPEISVQLHKTETRVELLVRDNGTGIKPEHIEQVFDPFFSTKDAGEGMGLGLAICHRIMKNHEGSLDVKSVLGEWTEFKLSMPLPAECNNEKSLNAVA